MSLDKLNVLKEYFGHTEFREGQEGLIDSILAGRDVVGVMPTGAGKSLCYQIPALMSSGITIVVSPLISLMKDQVNSLIQSGVRAAYLNSSLSLAQYDMAVKNAKMGAYKLIYVAPERLCTPSFLSLAASVRISLIAVDEAHCVSQWGQDFRPSYMRIPEFVERLSYRPVIAAFTATATRAVRQDIAAMLGLRDPYCVTTGFDRKNLSFEVVRGAEKFSETVRIIERSEGRSGIIYCSTRKNVEDVCERLNDRGIACTRYHAGLSDEERRKNQDDFIYDRVRVIAATNAFGMGIDKSNVGFVIHYNMPKDLESYYQEAGRAGRDDEPAECVLIYSTADVQTDMFLINKSIDESDLDPDLAETLRKRDIERLRLMNMYCTTTGCLREYILSYFGEAAEGYCGNCSNCRAGFEEQDVTLEAQKILSCIYRLAQRRTALGARMICDILRGSTASKITARGYDTLSTYGIMKDTSSTRIRLITEALEHQGYVRTTGEYSVLSLTREAKQVLTEGEKVTVRLPKKKKSEPRRERVKLSDGVYSFDIKLFRQLKALRAELAAEAKMPAYIIFADNTLRDLCVKQPTDMDELLDCSGIGRAKQQRYGKRILEEIRKYREEMPQGSDPAAPLSAAVIEPGKARSSDMLAKLIRYNAEKLTAVDEELTLGQVADRMLECLCISADRRRIQQGIEKWLTDNGYLTLPKDGLPADVTILSEEAGIQKVRRLSKLGSEYSTIVYPRTAQEFIFENIGEIF
ncbi:MAG: DNA helicase RecQ [Ruminococcus sp.]|nr:DNA helicase RecQ [Ruminococcus sp.]